MELVIEACHLGLQRIVVHCNELTIDPGACCS